MTSQSTLLLLRERLLHDADPHLLEFVSTPTRCHDILVMSLGQFCAEAGVDERQATAFFKAFGANSFLTFKRILRECLYSEPTELGTVSRSTASIASEIIRDELLNLTELWQNLDCAGLQRLAEDIATASEIFIIGQGTSSTYARELSRMLGTLGINSRFSSLKDPEQFAELELALGRDPLLITFAFPRYSKPLLIVFVPSSSGASGWSASPTVSVRLMLRWPTITSPSPCVPLTLPTPIVPVWHGSTSCRSPSPCGTRKRCSPKCRSGKCISTK